MFKIESYITPLLMGYVDRYVQLRPSDFQLSLWGGDAVLNNLDLRLDVIEKAIQLPITFKSGHIHELRIHVPWTKLGSEPVVVTINTIECILRMRDTGHDDMSSTTSGSSNKGPGGTQQARGRVKGGEELPPGYLQSLVNKIINNVNIVVNNLILKFVEDDVVLSVNVKSADCYTVESDWNRAFLELSPQQLILRKVINFSDLTICLDKRDASGKIDLYQEPVLYRCSVACRVHMMYDSLHAKLPLFMKMNVLCETLELTLTDTQLPMLLRLVELVLALYYGTYQFTSSDDSDSAEPEHQTIRQPPDKGPDAENRDEDPEQVGWGSWMWSYVPQILPDAEEEVEYRPRRKLPPSIMAFGFYIKKASLMFKLTESVRESAQFHGPNRLHFKPFLFLEAQGIATEVVVQGLQFFNAQFGMTNIRISAQGPCICGATDDADPRTSLLLSGGSQMTAERGFTHLTGSLFDPTSVENSDKQPELVTDSDKHMESFTESYGIQRYGAFWLDYLYTMDDPKSRHGSRSSRSSVSDDHDEILTIREGSLIRFLISACHLNVSSTCVHRIKKLMHCARNHTYEPYAVVAPEIVDEERSPPTEQQVRCLEDYIPTRTYHVTLLQPTITVMAAEHAGCDVQRKKYPRSEKTHKGDKSSSVPPSTTAYKLPAVQLYASRFDLQITSAMYARKLVQMVSKIAGPSRNLLHHCQSHMQIKLFGFQSGVLCLEPTGASCPIQTLVPPTSGALYYRTLLLPVYWKNPHLVHHEQMYELPQFSLNLTKPQLLLLTHIMSSWKQAKPKPAAIFDNSLIEDVFVKQDNCIKYPVLECSLSGFEMKRCSTLAVSASTGTLSTVQTLVYSTDSGTDVVTPVLCAPVDTGSLHSTNFFRNNELSSPGTNGECLTFTYQIPARVNMPEAPGVVLLTAEGIVCSVDPVLLDWLSYVPRMMPQPEANNPKEPKISVNLELADAASPLKQKRSQVSSGSVTHQTESHTTHTPGPTTLSKSHSKTVSDGSKITDGKAEEENTWAKKLTELFPLVRILQLQLEVQNCCIFLPLHHMTQSEPGLNIAENFRTAFHNNCLPESVVCCLPRVRIHSSGLRAISVLQEIPIQSLESSLVGDKLPWSLELTNLSVYSLHGRSLAISLLKSPSVTSTIAVTSKYSPPTSDTISTLGLCLHTDLHLLQISLSQRQVVLCHSIIDQLNSGITNLTSLVISNSSTESAESKPTPAVSQSPVIEPQTEMLNSAGSFMEGCEGELTETSGDMSRETTPNRELEIEETSTPGVKLTLWMQWTLPKMQLVFYEQQQNNDTAGTKVAAVIEDLTTSIDVQEVYSKVQMSINYWSIKHYCRKYPQNNWAPGPCEGILLSSSSDMGRNIHIIQNKLWSSGNIPSPVLGETRDKHNGVFSFTFTRALCKNVKRKFRNLNVQIAGLDGGENVARRESFAFSKHISEVCLNFEPCDIVLYMPVLMSVMSVFSIPHSSTVYGKTFQSRHRKTPVPSGDRPLLMSSSSLPLTYINLSQLRVYIPGDGKDCSKNGESNGDSVTVDSSQDTGISDGNSRRRKCVRNTTEDDMCVVLLQTLAVHPQADNPLQRTAIDKGLYHQALHAGITQLPGSAIEDRQYQIDVKGLTLCTGRWEDIVHERQSVSFKEQKKTTVQIPAYDWNTFLQPQHNDQEDIKLFPLVSSFDLKIVGAPAITYRTASDTEISKTILVCGYALEVNVTSDMDFFLSTNQIKLLIRLANSFVSSPPSEKRPTKTDEKLILRDQPVSDSGVESDASTITNLNDLRLQTQGAIDTEVMLRTPNVIPFDVLLTAGRISCVLYSHVIDRGNRKKKERKKTESKATKSDLEWKGDAKHSAPFHDISHDDASGYDADTEYSVQTKECSNFNFLNIHESSSPKASEDPSQLDGDVLIDPFLFFYVSQPHTVLSYLPLSQKFEMSCYDVMIKGTGTDYYVAANQQKLLADCSDYSVHWLETRAGQPHAKTGILPSLFTLDIVDFLLEPACISLKFERPIRVNFSLNKVDQTRSFLDKFASGQTGQASAGMRTEEPHANSSSAPVSGLKQSTESKDRVPAWLHMLSKVHKLEVFSDQLVVSLDAVSCEQPCGVIASVARVTIETDFKQNEQGCVNEILNTLHVSDLMLKTKLCKDTRPFLGPLTVSGDVQCQWCEHSGGVSLPQINISLDTGLFLIHFGQEHVMCLSRLGQHLQAYTETLTSTQVISPTEQSSTKYKPKMKPFVINETSDDLRCEEIQYLMAEDSSITPSTPREIFFFNGDGESHPSMTWCYGQPRVLSLVKVAPVPFSLPVNEMRVDSDCSIQVPCMVQYLDMVSDQFVDYLEFFLSEVDSQMLPLPHIKTGNMVLIAAQVWRVTLFKSGSMTADPAVLPMSLAACMRVNSCFIPSLVPAMQFSLSCDLIKLHLSNHLKMLGREVPIKLHPFIFDAIGPHGADASSNGIPVSVGDSGPYDQEFAVISAEAPSVQVSQLQGTYSRLFAQVSSRLQCDVLEYRSLTMRPVLLPFDFEGSTLVNQSSKPSCIELNCDLGSVFLRAGKDTVHTLSCAVQAWSQLSIDRPVSDQPQVIFNHYVICNDTQVTIRFGQMGTDENIALHPREMNPYSWRSHKLAQEFHLCLDRPSWKWCDPFSLDGVGRMSRSVIAKDQSYTLIIKVKQLTNTQKQVIISGQLVVTSRLTQAVEVKVATHTSEKDVSVVVGARQTIPSYIVEQKDIKSIRFRLRGLKTLWSQDIRETRLVKIPLADHSSFIHVWCHFINFNDLPDVQRTLIMLCPLFVLRTHLPHPLYVAVETPKVKAVQKVEVIGRGEGHQLQCMGGEMVHSLTFQLGPNMKRSNPSVSLSTGIIEQVERAQPDKLDMDSFCSQWSADYSHQWPYTDTSAVKHDVTPMPIMHHTRTSQDPITETIGPFIQPSIDLNVALSEHWPGCNTLLLDIKPWCLLTNHCGQDLVVMATDGHHWDVISSGTLAPPEFEDGFKIGIRDGEVIYESVTIEISSEAVADQRYRNDSSLILYTDGHVEALVIALPEIYFFTLNSAIRHGIRVLTVSARYNFTNLTCRAYRLHHFCVPLGYGKVSITHTWRNIIQLDTHRELTADVQPVLQWSVIVPETLDPAVIHNKTRFCHYVMLNSCALDPMKTTNESSQELKFSDWSFPLRLAANENGIRLSLSVPDVDPGQDSRPLAISGHTSDNKSFYVVTEDSSPFCILQNNCSFQLFYGQTLMDLQISDASVQEETELVLEVPSVQPYSSVYYTLPFINSKFPEIFDQQTLPKLHLSARCSDGSHSRSPWSIGIDLLSENDTFVSIPSVADVKVHVDHTTAITCVGIDPVSKAEISAKEIRSRIKGKETIVILAEEKPKTGTFVGGDNESPLVARQQSARRVASQNKAKTDLSIGVFVKHLCFIVQSSDIENVSEILRLSIDNCIICSYPIAPRESSQNSGRRLCVGICLGDLQIDNQQQGVGPYDFPVALIKQTGVNVTPNIDNIAELNILEKHAVLRSCCFTHIQVVLGSNPRLRHTMIESIDISVKPVSLYIDDAFIYSLLKEMEGFMPTTLSHDAHPPIIYQKLPHDIKCTARLAGSPIKIHHFCIQPINVLLSVHASMMMFIASDHTPLSFGKFERLNLCTSGHQLTRALTIHYVSGAIFRAGLVVGSLDILGSPTGLARSIGAGVADLFRLPYSGMTRGPGAFVAGVTKGVASLLRNISAGTITSITNFASSVSRNMDRLSMDQSHLERQAEGRRQRPTGVSTGLRQGLTGFGLSLLGAVAGIADHPLQGIMAPKDKPTLTSSKATGFVAGVGKGLVGVVTKPIGGVAEFVSQTGQGILNTTGLSRLPDRRYQLEPIPVSEATNGTVKYLEKLLPSVPACDLLMALPAVQPDLSGTSVTVVLLLTTEVIYVVSVEEDAQQQAFSLGELVCSGPVSEAGVLHVVWRDTVQPIGAEPHESSKARVAAFIDGTSGFIQRQEPPIVASSNSQSKFCDVGSSSQSEASPAGRTATPPQYEFHINPSYRHTFLALFQNAKCKLEGKGFPC